MAERIAAVFVDRSRLYAVADDKTDEDQDVADEIKPLGKMYATPCLGEMFATPCHAHMLCHARVCGCRYALLKKLDADGDGQLDEDELMLLDADGDGKVDEDEIREALLRKADSAGVRERHAPATGLCEGEGKAGAGGLDGKRSLARLAKIGSVMKGTANGDESKRARFWAALNNGNMSLP